jgi:hypothetical protein
VYIQAPPDEVYRRIIGNVGDWWDPTHTYSHDPHNLSIEEKAMGCFCEKLPNSGVVRHMEVISLMPGKSIVLVGALGPLQSIAAAGSMKFQFAPAAGGAKLEFMTRLKNYIEHGNPAPK